MHIRNVLNIILLLTVVSCSHPTTTTKEKQSTSTKEIETSRLVEYNLFLSRLDSLDVQTSTLAASKFEELFKDEANKNIIDKAYISFNLYYEKLDRNINETHEKDTTNYDSLIFLSDSEKRPKLSKHLQDYERKLKANGFEVSSTEGITFIQQDRDFIAARFYDYVSLTMKEYLVQLNKENKEGFSEDAGLILSPKQFVDRLIWWEKFLDKHPDFILVEEAKERRKHLLTFLIIGMENTYVVSYEDGSLEDYYQEAYSYLERTYPTSIANRFVNPYYKALLKKDQSASKRLVRNYEEKGIISKFQ